MNQKYEYKFIRLGEGWLGVKRSTKYQYQQVVTEYAQQGWRLVQIFAPSIAAYGVAKYFELIFERQLWGRKFPLPFVGRISLLYINQPYWSHHQ